MSLLFTTAHTSGFVAIWRLQETALTMSITPAIRSGFGLKARPFPARPSSRSFFDAAGADTGSAGADLFARTVDDRLDIAQIRIPAATAHVVRVTDHISEARLFTANLTS